MAKLKDILKNELTEKELKSLPSSFDIIGDAIIFNSFPEGLLKKEKIIGEEILKNYKNIKSVFKKIKKYSGKFRLQKLKLLAGANNKEVIYKENNIKLKLNVEKVYFSPRLSGERKRILGQVKGNETVLVMFSGIAAYPVVIAKNSTAKDVIGIEVNPTAHRYAVENLKLNKVKNVRLIFGDAKKEVPKLDKKFDKIIMPLPKGGKKFLGLALNKIKDGGIIYLYDFAEENKYEEIAEAIGKECKKMKMRWKILNINKCGQFSPRIFRICVDFKVKK